MTNDDLNKLKAIKATLENAWAQTSIFWMKEISASAMISLDALITKNTKLNEPAGDTPCPECNPTGVFNYSPVKGCSCGGRAWIWSKQ